MKKEISQLNKKAIRDWKENTTLHGIINIQSSPSIAAKLAWSLLFTFLFAFSIWLIFLSFSTYFNYEIDTTIKITAVNEITFPSVTFCNLNFLNTKSTDLTDDLKTKLANLTLETYISSFFDNVKLNYNITEINIKEFVEVTVDYYKSMILNESVNLGFTLDEMLIACYFMRNSCYSEDFLLTLSTVNGNCFTFASKADKISKISGSGYGLQLELLIGDNDMGLERAKGILVVVHETGYFQTLFNQMALITFVNLISIIRYQAGLYSRCSG